MIVIDLVCPVCKKPLSIMLAEDDNLKRLGCRHCVAHPVVVHSDFNRVIEKYIELREQGKI